MFETAIWTEIKSIQSLPDRQIDDKRLEVSTPAW
jgi:hypothetical protein